jgi:hypothetical protein
MDSKSMQPGVIFGRFAIKVSTMLTQHLLSYSMLIQCINKGCKNDRTGDQKMGQQPGGKNTESHCPRG